MPGLMDRAVWAGQWRGGKGSFLSEDATGRLLRLLQRIHVIGRRVIRSRVAIELREETNGERCLAK